MPPPHQPQPPPANTLNTPITAEEISLGLQRLHNGRAGALQGYSSEFLRYAKPLPTPESPAPPNLIIPCIQAMFNEAYGSGIKIQQYLGIKFAVVTAFSTNSVFVLEALVLVNCELRNLHSNGLSALTNLRELVLMNSKIQAGSVVDDFDCRTLWTGKQPEGVSSLTKLTSLLVYSPRTDTSALKWVYQLTSLKALHLVCFGGVLEVKEKIGQLSNLTSLSFQGAADDTGQGITGELDLDYEPKTEVYVQREVEWQTLSSLMHFRVDHATINMSAELLGLAALKHLEKVELVGNCKPAMGHNVRWFAAFVHQMALQRPLAEVIINEGSVADAVADL